VVESSQTYLKIFREEPPQPARPEIEDLGSLAEVLKAFERVTGRSLRYVPGPQPSPPADLTWSAPVNPGVGVSPGHVRLLLAGDHGGEARAPVSLEEAGLLADAVGGLWSELLTTRHALWQREAELATGVPLIVRDDDEQTPSLGERLEAVLRGGAEAVGRQLLQADLSGTEGICQARQRSRRHDLVAEVALVDYLDGCLALDLGQATLGGEQRFTHAQRGHILRPVDGVGHIHRGAGRPARVPYRFESDTPLEIFTLYEVR